MKARLRKITINLSLAVVSLFVTLLLLEGVLRLVFPASERGLVNIHQADEALGWDYVPGAGQWYTSPGEFRNYVQINANGLRDVERTYEKTADSYRILMVGDSFVAGLQVPITQTFTALVETSLRQTVNSQIELLNAGIGGYGTDQELRWLRQEGWNYTPDKVILVIYLGNDIADNDYELASLAVSTLPPKPFFHLANGSLEDAGYMNNQSELSNEGEWSIVGIRRFLQKNSYIFSLASASLTHLEGQPAFQGILRSLGQGGNEYNHYYDIFAQTPPPAWERAWELAEKLIETMAQEAAAQGAELGVVLIPHPVQIHQDWWQARLSLYPAMSAIEWDLQKPNTRLTNFLTAQAIPYLDLSAPLKEYATQNQTHLFYRSDGHLTVEGNEVAGAAMAAWLEEQLR